jgi:hypothetical protein
MRNQYDTMVGLNLRRSFHPNGVRVLYRIASATFTGEGFVSGSQQTVIVRHSGSPGIVAGLLGCGLGILGIFTFGIVFVPLAALCSVIGFIRGAMGRSGTGVGVSILGITLAVVGFMVSPSLWLLLAVGAAAH